MAAPVADPGSTGVRMSSSTESPRLLDKYKAIALENIKLEELLGKREIEWAEEREKTEKMEIEVEKLKKTVAEQKDQLERKDKLIDKLKADLARMEIDFSEKLEMEKKRHDNELIQLENKVDKCVKESVETIEALEKQLLDYEKSQKKLEKILRKKQAEIATLNSSVEEGYKTILEVVEKQTKICSGLSSQDDSDFDQVNEDTSASIEDDDQSSESHFRTSSCDNETASSSKSSSSNSRSESTTARKSLNCKNTREGGYFIASTPSTADCNATELALNSSSNHGSQSDTCNRDDMPISTRYPAATTPVSLDPLTDTTLETVGEQEQIANVQTETHQPVLFDPQNTVSGERYKCRCGRSYFTKNSLHQHIQSKTRGKIFKCSWCPSRFDFHGSLKSHVTRVHNRHYTGKLTCSGCGETFSSRTKLRSHRQRMHKRTRNP